MEKYPLQLQTEPFTIEREWAIDAIPVLTANISVPQPVLTSGANLRRIRRFYRLQARAYLRYCERRLFPLARQEYVAAQSVSAPLPCFHAALTYQITYNENNLWSLYTQSWEALGSGCTFLSRYGDTWDLSSGSPVPLNRFFPSVKKWKKTFFKCAAQEISRQESSGVSRYHPDWQKRLHRCFNSRNFYLTPEGITVFYPMYSIAPPVEGIPVFTIPFDLPCQ